MRIALFGPAGALGRRISAIATNSTDIVPVFRSMYNLMSVESIEQCLANIEPDAIINCTGVFPIKGSSAVDMVLVNALFPHFLAKAAKQTRVVLVSTDRVFSGRMHNRHTVSSHTTAEDMFGKSRAVGEVLAPNVAVVRTSYIDCSHGFMRWLIAANDRGAGEVEGWKNSLWSGSTIDAVASAITELATSSDRVGIQHLSTQKTINKYDLACKIVDCLGLDLKVVPALLPMMNYSLQPTIELPPIDEVLSGYECKTGYSPTNGAAVELRTENTRAHSS